MNTHSETFHVSVRSSEWAKPYFDFFAVKNHAYKIVGARKTKTETNPSNCLDFSQHVDLLLEDTRDGDLYFTCTKDCKRTPVRPDTAEGIEHIAFLRGSEYKEWKPGRKVFFKLSRPGLVLSSELKWDSIGECYILKN